jgi:hypothetical protein
MDALAKEVVEEAIALIQKPAHDTKPALVEEFLHNELLMLHRDLGPVLHANSEAGQLLHEHPVKRLLQGIGRKQILDVLFTIEIVKITFQHLRHGTF